MFFILYWFKILPFELILEYYEVHILIIYHSNIICKLLILYYVYSLGCVCPIKLSSTSEILSAITCDSELKNLEYGNEVYFHSGWTWYTNRNNTILQCMYIVYYFGVQIILVTSSTLFLIDKITYKLVIIWNFKYCTSVNNIL